MLALEMEKYLESELVRLRQQVLTMASHAENAVSLAVQALLQRDAELALRVKADDRIIDRFEIEIDNEILRLLTKAPLAADLRLVTVSMKISQNFERIGDEASKIAGRARDLCWEPPLKLQLDVPRLAGLALDMLKSALDAFGQRDPNAARAVIPRDVEVNEVNHQIHAALVRHMVEHPDTISRCLHWLVVAKSLERIADHATNVAEYVIYCCEARDIRLTSRIATAPAGNPAPATVTG
jgi:phosphate transport system protein